MQLLSETILALNNTRETRKKLYDIQYKEDCAMADVEQDYMCDMYFLNRKHELEKRAFEKQKCKKIYHIPTIEVKYKEFLCFRFRIVKMNGSTLSGESYDIDLYYMKWWLNNAKNNFWKWLKMWGRGGTKSVIILGEILAKSIAEWFEDEENEEEEEWEDLEDIEIIRV